MKKIPGLPHLKIGTIFCIGRNYAKHAEEMGGDLPDKPMVFLKPASSVIGNNKSIRIPEQSRNVHHEVELVIAIGKKGKNIPKRNSLRYIAGYGIGIDVTARDIQQQAKDRGHPWSVAKGYDTFAPISHFESLEPATRLDDMLLCLSVNGEERQNSSTNNMIFTVDELIAYLSTIFTLNPGDLIFTGTPDGVSQIKPHDTITADLNEDEVKLSITVK